MKEVAAPKLNGLAGPVAQAGAGRALLQLLQGLRLEGLEKSFKMSDRTLLADRYLAGVHKSDISPAMLYSICERMGMPPGYVDSLKENAEAANAIHFGFEGSGAGGIYKVYLEFASRLAQASAVEPVLLHLAYKWDVAHRGAGTVARYVCHPRLSAAGVTDRLAALYSGSAGDGPFEAVREIIGLAAARTREPLMYLEVSEENNPRASFDIKVHDADLRVSEIGPWLARLREHYAIPAGLFRRVYDPIGESRLGHLSGGINREGRDFLTVYYAVDGL